MKPTIENWQVNPIEIGPIYPWVGLEVWMVIAATLFCVFFLAWKLKSENRHYDEMTKQLRADASRGDTRQHEEPNHG